MERRLLRVLNIVRKRIIVCFVHAMYISFQTDIRPARISGALADDLGGRQGGPLLSADAEKLA
eukprot:3504380-Pyramimonas_sp.AAC.1